MRRRGTDTPAYVKDIPVQRRTSGTLSIPLLPDWSQGHCFSGLELDTAWLWVSPVSLLFLFVTLDLSRPALRNVRSHCLFFPPTPGSPMCYTGVLLIPRLRSSDREIGSLHQTPTQKQIWSTSRRNAEVKAKWADCSSPTRVMYYNCTEQYIIRESLCWPFSLSTLTKTLRRKKERKKDKEKQKQADRKMLHR